MPIYLVKASATEAHLIRAKSMDELTLMFDEYADLGFCEAKVYDGPLWLQVTLPSVGVDDVDVDALVQKSFGDSGGALSFEPACAETSDAMRDAIMLRAFPGVARVWGKMRVALSGLHESLRDELATKWRAKLVRAVVADAGAVQKRADEELARREAERP